MRGNTSALEQIITNVLKNAIHYSHHGGTLLVTLGPDYHGSVDFLVEDHGVGIKRQDLEHIFEPFYRADSSRNRASGGSGLGLAIVAELVKLHVGKIRVSSVPGKGTMVAVSLPASDVEHAGQGDQAGDAAVVAMDFSRKGAN